MHRKYVRYTPRACSTEKLVGMDRRLPCELPEAAGHRNMQSLNDSHVHRARQYNNATYSKLEAAWMCLARVVRLALIVHSCEAGNHLPDRSILLLNTHVCGSIPVDSSHFRHSGAARTA